MSRKIACMQAGVVLHRPVVGSLQRCHRSMLQAEERSLLDPLFMMLMHRKDGLEMTSSQPAVTCI